MIRLRLVLLTVASVVAVDATAVVAQTESELRGATPINSEGPGVAASNLASASLPTRRSADSLGCVSPPKNFFDKPGSRLCTARMMFAIIIPARTMPTPYRNA